MKEIKFVAYDKRLKYRQYIDLYWFEENGVHEIINNEADGHYGDYYICQYIGARDMYGVDIYEGDIIKNSSGIGEVKFIPEHFAFVIRMIDPHKYCFIESDGELKDTEIIGNIYENPELLERD